MASESVLWKLRGACLQAHPDTMFVTGAAQHHAKQLCLACPVVRACGEYALRHRIEHGVWGGMTERQRRAVLKRRAA